MNILQYIQRINQLYGSEQLVAGLSESFPGTYTSYQDAVYEGFQGTREEWLQQQSIPQIDRPFTGKAGGSVYDTRKYFKPGGLVEPGERIPFGDGSVTKSHGDKYHLRIRDGKDRKTYYGTEESLEKKLAKYKANIETKKGDFISKLSVKEKNIVLGWGRNKGQGKWSNKKILEMYNELSRQQQHLIRKKKITGKGFSTIEGAVKKLTPDQQKLWDATMADEFGKW